jgi:hypothetical protein
MRESIQPSMCFTAENQLGRLPHGLHLLAYLYLTWTVRIRRAATKCCQLSTAADSNTVGKSQLTEEILAAVQLRRGDGGWVIGRRASNAIVCGAVAVALVTHFATRPDNDLDIMVG